MLLKADTVVELFARRIEADGSRPALGLKRGGLYQWLTWDDVGADVRRLVDGGCEKSRGWRSAPMGGRRFVTPRAQPASRKASCSHRGIWQSTPARQSRRSPLNRTRCESIFCR